MGYGLQVVGAHGVTQIDQDFVNLAVVAKGTLNLPAYNGIAADGQPNGLATAQLTVGGVSRPMLFIRTSGNVPVAVASNGGVPTVTYTFYNPSAVTIYWYVFDETSAGPGADYGLTVYTAGGTLAYASNWSVLRLGAVGSIPNADSNTYDGAQSATVAAPYTATWAACIASVRTAYATGTESQVIAWADGCYISGNSAVVKPVETYNITFMFASDYRFTQPIGGKLLLADVTGY